MVTVEYQGCRYIEADDVIAALTKEGAEFEPLTWDWMLGVMEKREGAYVDVGAYTGWFVCPMAKAGYRVIAFEPHPVVAKRLADNIRLNSCDVAVYVCAASDVSGIASMQSNAQSRLSSGGSIDHRPECEETTSVQVKTGRLDEIITGPVALMKIDVEGNEIKTLAGAKETIKKYRPHLVLEANGEAEKNHIKQWAKAAGYSVCKLTDLRNLLLTPEKP